MRTFARIFTVLFALFVPTAVGRAAPLGITSETAVAVNFGYQYLGGNAFALGASFETPFSVVSFIDSSVVARAGFAFNGGFDVGVGAKAIVFPSLSGGLLAAGLYLDTNFYGIGSGASVFKIGLGPLLTVNLEPAYLSFSASLLALTNGVYGFDLGIAARYYIDAFALDLSVDYNTVGWARASFGIRYTL
jgi:hypothetical protein